jgi:hypothetical protein
MAERVDSSPAIQLGPSDLEWAGSPRLRAVAAGDLLQTARRQVRAALRRARGNRFEAMRQGLGRLVEEGLIAERDRERLETIVNAVQTAREKSIGADEAPEKIRAAYHALVADSRSGAVAVAIASVANSLFTPSALTSANSTLTLQVVSMGSRAERTIQGAIIGGLLGFIVAGPSGALAGAIVGANAGAKSPSSDPD